ncbi:hypothetical protein KL944_005053 [Ogataea haglerorum]|nr:hypothetical protein KL944_005053 [Ogataea haglerorum]
MSGSYPPRHKPQTAPVLAALLAVSPVPSNASPISHSLQNSPPIPAGAPALIGMVLVVATKLAECYSTYFCGRKPYQNVGETVAVLVVMTTHWGFGYLFDSVALLAVVQALNIVAVLGLFLAPRRNRSALAKAQYGSLDMADSQASLCDSFGIASIDKDLTKIVAYAEGELGSDNTAVLNFRAEASKFAELYRRTNDLRVLAAVPKAHDQSADPKIAELCEFDQLQTRSDSMRFMLKLEVVKREIVTLVGGECDLIGAFKDVWRQLGK